MNQRYFIYILISVAVVFIFYYSFQSDPQEYIDKIAASRQAYKKFLATTDQSPLKQPDDTTGIRYYPPNPEYRVTAEVEKFPDKNTVNLQTNKGKEEAYYRYAKLHFQLKGASHTILLYQHTDNKSEFFLPFTDETNGEVTYGAGRYVQVPDAFNGNPTIELDFNRAFNPYCAYNEDYSCPVPPKENHLSISVKAGEKSFSY